MSDPEIKVKISSDASEFSAGTEEAAESTESLTGSLRELKTEGTGAGRTARYFAAELAEIIPGAEGAKSALAGLIKIGLEGFTLGGAITAAAVASHYLQEAFAEVNAEEEKAQAAAKKWADDAAASVKKYIEQLKAAAEAEGKIGTAKSVSTEAAPLRRRAEEGQKEWDDAKANLAFAKHELDELNKANKSAFGSGEIDEATAKVKKFEKAIEEARDKTFEARKAISDLNKAPEVTEAIGKEAEEAALKKLKASFEAHQKILGYDTEETTHLKTELDKQVQAFVDAEKKKAEAAIKRRTAQFDADQEAVKFGQQMADQNLKNEIDREKRLEEFSKKQLEETKKEEKQFESQFLTPMLSGFHTAIADMITGTKSFSDAMQKLFQDMVSNIINVSLKQLEKGITDALFGGGSGGGPGGIFSALAGLLGGGAGGASGIAAGADGLIDIAPLLLTRPVQFGGGGLGGSAGGASASSAGGGGITVINNVNAIDGRSVRDFVSSNDFINAVAEAQRNGRLR